MTRSQWDKLWEERFGALRKAHPTADLDKLREKARQQCVKNYGPRPGTLMGALTRVAWHFARKGGNVDFSWSKNLWKAVRAGLVTALSVAIVAGADVLLQPIDSAQELHGIGIPGWAIPAIVAIIASLRNYLKVTRAKKK